MTESNAVDVRPAEDRARTALLRQIAESRRMLDAVVATLPSAALAVGVSEQWQAGDYLWHLTALESSLYGRLRGQSWAEGLGIDRGASADPKDFDAINELVRERGRGLSSAELLSAYRDVHQRVLDLLDQVPDGAIFEATPEGGYRPLEHVRCNTYEHFDEHRMALEALAARHG